MNQPVSLDLDEIVLSYLRAVDSGQAPEPDAVLQLHPQFASELRPFFQHESLLSNFGLTPSPNPTFSSAFPASPCSVPSVEANQAGRLRLGETLGSGGMGDVRRGHDPVLDRDLAVKILQDRHHGQAALARRFLEEARIAAGLQHPGVPPVHDIGALADGRPFIAMKLIEGRTLAQLLAERKSPGADLPRFLKIFEQTAQTLAYVHSRGVVHRDLKPHNVMVGAFGEVQVMDWGLAKQLRRDDPRTPVPDDDAEPKRDPAPADATRVGTVIGTPAYMAPEQARGENDLLDERTDVFGLGAILCQILTGTPPFAASPEALRSCRLGELSEVFRRIDASDADADLKGLAKRCLAPLAADRPRSGLAVASEITAHLVGVQERLRQAELARARAEESRKRRRLATALLAFVAAVSLGAAFWLKAERDAAQAAELRSLQSENGRKQELYRAYLHEARAVRSSGQVGQRETGLAAIRKILAALPESELSESQRDELRDEALACLALADLREQHKRPVRTRTYRDLDIDDALHWVAQADEQPDQTLLQPLVGDGPMRRFPFRDWKSPLFKIARHFSPGGRFVVELRAPSVVDDHSMRIWDQTQGKLVAEAKLPGECHRLAFSPDGRQAVIFFGDSVLRLYDLGTGALHRFSPPRFSPHSAAISPDGKRLAVASFVHPCEIIDLETWATVASLPNSFRATAVAWLPDGSGAVFGGDDGLLRTWRPGAPLGAPLKGVHRDGVDRLCFSPDGRLLASSGFDGAAIVRRFPNDRVLFSLPGSVLKFSHDSERVAVVNGQQLSVHELAGLDTLQSIHVDCVDSVEFSPDGRLLGLGGTRGAQLLDAATLLSRANLQMDACGAVAFHPDGRELMTFGRFSHLWRWPLKSTGQAVEVGPAQSLVPRTLLQIAGLAALEPHHEGKHAAWSLDGKILAVADYRNGSVCVADARKSQPIRVLGALVNAGRVAVSPDGAFVAGAGVSMRRSVVWEAATGRVVFDLPDHGDVKFSHDGRWLATSSRTEVHVHRARDWSRAHRFVRDEGHEFLAAPFALQPQGGLLAFATARGKVRLCDLETGRCAAVLVLPQSDHLAWLSFSPDGTRLAAVGGTNVSVWNLAALSAQLKELGLTGSSLAESPAASAPPLGEVRVERGADLPAPSQWATKWKSLAQWESLRKQYSDAAFNMGQAIHELLPDASIKTRADLLVLRGSYHRLNQNTQAALDDWQHALDLMPDHVEAALALARQCLVGSRDRHDAARAHRLLAPLAGHDRPDAEAATLLGIAQIKLRRTREGIALLEKTDAGVLAGFQQLHLALAYHESQQRPAALVALDAAGAAVPSGLSGAERDEWTRLRKEVEALVRAP